MSSDSIAAARFQVDFSAPGKPIKRSWELAVGSGDAWSILRADLQQQLRRAVGECGFRYLRCHGILSDQLQAVRRDRDGKIVYNWQLVDGVYDALLEIGMRPMVELGFMPSALASGDQAVFYYRANVTPPADYEEWNRFIDALVRHWRDRYGEDELRHWYFEVWNEANLSAFWSGTQADYFRLYAETARTIKAIDPALRVGGPATSRGEWLLEFMAWCKERAVPVDFVSTHVYPDDDDFGKVDPDYRAIFNRGEYLEKVVRQATEQMANQRPLGADGRLEIHWTEWNSSWRWGQPVHDVTNQAAYICRVVHHVHEQVDSFAFWTISDIFNEFPYPRASFVGGFGLITIDGVPKPGYHAYALLHRLGDTELPVERLDRGEADAQNGSIDCWATRSSNGYQLLLSNYQPPGLDGASPVARPFAVRCEALRAGTRLHAVQYRVDGEHGNGLAAWERLGRPDVPNRDQLAEMRMAAQLLPVEESTASVDGEGQLLLSGTMQPGSITFFALSALAD